MIRTEQIVLLDRSIAELINFSASVWHGKKKEYLVTCLNQLQFLI